MEGQVGLHYLYQAFHKERWQGRSCTFPNLGLQMERQVAAALTLSPQRNTNTHGRACGFALHTSGSHMEGQVLTVTFRSPLLLYWMFLRSVAVLLQVK